MFHNRSSKCIWRVGMSEASRRAAEIVEQVIQAMHDTSVDGDTWNENVKARRALAARRVDAVIARVVADTQHVCTHCGYIAITQSVEREQIVARAVAEWKTAAGTETPSGLATRIADLEANIQRRSAASSMLMYGTPGGDAAVEVARAV